MDLMPILNHTLTFSNQTREVVTIFITPDVKLEKDEKFFAMLSTTEAGVMLAPSEAQITIVNDDSEFQGYMYVYM